MQFGGWMYTAFKLLAKLKVLRGSALDVFAYSEERKQERLLISRYESTIEQLLTGLNENNIGFAEQIARLPDDIKGYGHIKQRNLDVTLPKWDAMLAAYEKGELSYREEEAVQVINFPLEQLPG